MKPIIYILIFFAVLAVSDLAIKAYYEVESFDWSYVEDFKERTKPEVAPEEVEAFEIITAEITAYTSRPEETSGDPCISASGANICKDYNFLINQEKALLRIAACPIRYEFGTRIEIVVGIDEVFGAEIVEYYVCLDRMNKRYQDGNYFDIYMGQGEEAYQRAMEWGRQKNVSVKIYD